MYVKNHTCTLLFLLVSSRIFEAPLRYLPPLYVDRLKVTKKQLLVSIFYVGFFFVVVVGSCYGSIDL